MNLNDLPGAAAFADSFLTEEEHKAGVALSTALGEVGGVTLGFLLGYAASKLTDDQVMAGLRASLKGIRMIGGQGG